MLVQVNRVILRVKGLERLGCSLSGCCVGTRDLRIRISHIRKCAGRDSGRAKSLVSTTDDSAVEGHPRVKADCRVAQSLSVQVINGAAEGEPGTLCVISHRAVTREVRALRAQG